MEAVLITKEQAQERLRSRPVGANGYDRFLWLEANFPGFNDRYIGGSKLWKIGAQYGLTAPEVTELAAWMDGERQ